MPGYLMGSRPFWNMYGLRVKKAGCQLLPHIAQGLPQAGSLLCMGKKARDRVVRGTSWSAGLPVGHVSV